MPKAILSNRIYLDVTPSMSKHLAKTLTYKIKKNIPGASHFLHYDIIKNYKIISSTVMSIPIGRMDLIPADYDIIDKRVLYEGHFLEPKTALRDSQIDVFNETNESCFINAMVGWGKTYTALHIARKLNQRTLIVTHNTMLRDQWVEDIKTLYGMDPGLIGSGIFDIEDKAIVVGNIQTMTKKEVILKIAKEFGTVIMDEAHHCPASTFTTFIDSMHTRYKIGLSGTMVRKDGKHILFKDYFGPIVHQPPQENTLTPTVELVATGIALAHGRTWVEKINDLLYDNDYQEFISRIALAKMKEGHSVLVLADRVEFLKNVGEMIGKDCVCITGGTSLHERNQLKEQINSGEKTCVAGSRQIFSEGISINVLSCVILAVPIASDALLEQIIGRIMRKVEGKLTPLVVDLQFSGYADKKQNNARLGFYKRKGWEITT